MNFDNEKFSMVLNKIHPTKLLLLDFGKFEKESILISVRILMKLSISITHAEGETTALPTTCSVIL